MNGRKGPKVGRRSLSSSFLCKLKLPRETHMLRFLPWRSAALVSIAIVLTINDCGLQARDANPIFRAGAATSNITPPLGESIVGGWQPIPATNIHDELHARHHRYELHRPRLRGEPRGRRHDDVLADGENLRAAVLDRGAGSFQVSAAEDRVVRRRPARSRCPSPAATARSTSRSSGWCRTSACPVAWASRTDSRSASSPEACGRPRREPCLRPLLRVARK